MSVCSTEGIHELTKLQEILQVTIDSNKLPIFGKFNGYFLWPWKVTTSDRLPHSHISSTWKWAPIIGRADIVWVFKTIHLRGALRSGQQRQRPSMLSAENCLIRPEVPEQRCSILFHFISPAFYIIIRGTEWAKCGGGEGCCSGLASTHSHTSM